MGDGRHKLPCNFPVNTHAKKRKSLFRFIADSISSFVPSGMFAHAAYNDHTDNINQVNTPNEISYDSDIRNHARHAPRVLSNNCQGDYFQKYINNVDMDAGETSDAEHSAHSSTSGVSSLLPKKSLASRNVDDFLSLNSRSDPHIPHAYSATSSEAMDSIASSSTYCNKPAIWNASPHNFTECSFFSKPAKRRCPSDYHSDVSQTSERSSSMFYRSRTTYGGAASCRPPISRQKVFHSTVPLRFELESQTNSGVSQQNGNVSGTNLSSTARRILESLERFSTPLASAERIPLPLSNTQRQSIAPPNSFRTHRFPPYALAYNRLKATQQQRFQKHCTESNVPDQTGYEYPSANVAVSSSTSAPIDAPKLSIPAINQHSRFAFQNLPPLATSRTVIDQQTTATATMNTSWKPMPIVTTTCNNTSSVPTSETPVFAFATPIRRSPSIASQLALMTSTSEESTTFTFSLPGRLKSSASTSSLSTTNCDTIDVSPHVSTAVVSAMSSPIFDLIVSAPTKTTDAMFGERKTPFVVPMKNSAPNLNTWRCETCLLENVDSLNACSICSTPRIQRNSTELLPVLTGIVTTVSATSSVPTPTAAMISLTNSNASKWECSACMLYNDATLSSCAACGTARKTESSARPPAQCNFTVASTAQSKWECPTCMVFNESDKSSCPCCQTPNPNGTGVSSAKANSFGVFPSLPSAPTGEWECPTCMVRNSRGKDKCPCCATPNPSATKPSTSSLFMFGTTAASPPVIFSSSAPIKFGLFPTVNSTATANVPPFSSQSLVTAACFPTSQSSTTTPTYSGLSHTPTFGSSGMCIKETKSTSLKPMFSNNLFSFGTSTASTTTEASTTSTTNSVKTNITSTVASTASSDTTRSSTLPVPGSLSSFVFPSTPAFNDFKFGQVSSSAVKTSDPSHSSPFANKPISSISTTPLPKPSFVFGAPNTAPAALPLMNNGVPSSTVPQPGQPSASIFGQPAASTPFVFGSSSTGGNAPVGTSASGLFCFGATNPTASSNTSFPFSVPNASTKVLDQNSPSNIFSAGGSSSMPPRKKVHATRRLNR